MIKLKKRNYNTMIIGQKGLYKVSEENNIKFIFNKDTELNKHNLKDNLIIDGYTDINKKYIKKLNLNSNECKNDDILFLSNKMSNLNIK